MAQMNPNIFINKRRVIGENPNRTAIFFKTPYKGFGVWISKKWIKQAPNENYVFFSIEEKREYEIYQYEKIQGKYERKAKKVLGKNLYSEYKLAAAKNKNSFIDKQEKIDPLAFLETKENVIKTSSASVKSESNNNQDEFKMSKEELNELFAEFDEL